MQTRSHLKSHQSQFLEQRQVPHWPLIYICCSIGLLLILFREGLGYMLSEWTREEYSHGYIIPLISAYFFLQQLPNLKDLVPTHRIWGGFIVAIGLTMFAIGDLSALYVIIHYAFLLCLWGIFVSTIGFNGCKKVYVSFVYLLFMIPLPHFLHFSLSSQLQLISSSLGVDILRLFNVSVYLEGNVIDLGSYQLQVVDACSGLRYLFPLMSFGFLIANIYRSPRWFKALLFLSTIPITIIMNSFRISVIGITVNQWGIAAAEGFIHDFEGWVVFMGCVFLLFVEIWIFHITTKQKDSFANQLDVFLPNPIFKSEYINSFKNLSGIHLVILGLLIVMFPIMNLTSGRTEISPDRLEFTKLPLTLGQWEGRENRIDDEVQETLKFSDYSIADFRHPDYGAPVNMYMAYYDSQRKGASIHSPKTCIPGGGWEITSLTQRSFNSIHATTNQILSVNRAIIRKGDVSSLVYYWFQQRGRVITNEYQAKWYIFWDALTKNRTDGALVRITTQITNGINIDEADHELQVFLEAYTPILQEHIPN